MENNFKPFPHWNKLENHPNAPIPHTPIIASNDTYTQAGFLEWDEHNNCWMCSDDRYTIWGITHWMYMPEPVEEFKDVLARCITASTL